MRSVIGKRQGWWMAFAICLVASAGVAMAQTTPPPPAIDTMTSGAWMGTYGQCTYVLGAYDSSAGCEIPVLDDSLCLPPTCQYIGGVPVPVCGGNYIGGAGQTVLDCETNFDLDGNGVDDFSYKVYAGRNQVRVLTNPDGTCSGQNSLWFNDTVFGCNTPDNNFSYTIAGVPAGTYRLASYVMDWDTNGVRNQDITVCVGSVCSNPSPVGSYQNGVYQIFYVNVASGESIKVTHTNTAGANAVAQGVFFDPYAGPMCANGKACESTAQDRMTGGDWTATYGKAGYILLNRPDAVQLVCESSNPATYQVGGFAGGVTPVVSALDNAESYYWSKTSDYACGKAMAWVYNCNDGTGRALENPGDCGGVGNCAGGFTTASTWDDAGEGQANGPDLFVDVILNLPGQWRLSFYALDYDTANVRRETFHLYQYHTLTPIFAPVDIGPYSSGVYVTYTLTGPFQVTLRAEKTAGANAIISGVFVDPAEGFLCTGQEIPPPCGTNAGDFCTYTMGGWGAKYHGGNPGTIRNNYWNTVYPPAVVGDSDGDGYGDLVIGTSAGGCKSVTYTDPTAVEIFLPCGGTPMAMKKSEVDPTCPKGNSPGKLGLKNTLESQVTALRLNMDYSCAGVLSAKYPNPGSPVCLGDLIITSGPFAGLTVRQFEAKAEAALSCGTLDAGLTFADYNGTATGINENFDGCQASNGFLECPPTPAEECGIQITKDVATGHADINGDTNQPDAYPGDQVSFTLNVEAKCDLTAVTVTDVLPTFSVGGVAYDYYVSPGSVTFVPNVGQTFTYDDATNTFTFNLGNLVTGSKVTIMYTATLSLLAPIGPSAVNTATATGTHGDQTYTETDTGTVYVVPGVSPNLAGGDVGTPGFWCNHIDQSKPNPFDAARINGWFALIEGASRYWSELGGELKDNALPPTFQKALSVICYTGNNEKQKLERHLLVLWLNVASFDVWTDIRLEQLCLGKPFPAGTNLKWTIGEVITFAETALINNDTANFLFWKDICDAINNSAPMVGGGACNGLTLDPITAFDPRFDGLACDCTPLP